MKAYVELALKRTFAAAAAVGGLGFAGCSRPLELPVAPQEGSERPAIPEAGKETESYDLSNTSRTFGESGTNPRIWVGVYCELVGSRVPVPVQLVARIDGLELFRKTSDCGDVGAPGEAAPNVGFFALTLDVGEHVLTIEDNLGQKFSHRVSTNNDVWVTAYYSAKSGEFAVSTDFANSSVKRPADRTYVPRPQTSPQQNAFVPSGTPAFNTTLAPGPVAPLAPAGQGLGSPVPEPVATAASPSPRSGPEASSRDAAPAPRSAAPQSAEGQWRDASLGSLRIVSPEPARVSIDGRPAGKDAPFDQLELSAGRHRVVLTTNSGVERSYSVEIEPGKTRTIVYVVE